MGYVLTIFKFFLSALRSIKNYVNPFSLCTATFGPHGINDFHFFPHSHRKPEQNAQGDEHPQRYSSEVRRFLAELRIGRKHCSLVSKRTLLKATRKSGRVGFLCYFWSCIAASKLGRL